MWDTELQELLKQKWYEVAHVKAVSKSLRWLVLPVGVAVFFFAGDTRAEFPGMPSVSNVSSNPFVGGSGFPSTTTTTTTSFQLRASLSGGGVAPYPGGSCFSGSCGATTLPAYPVGGGCFTGTCGGGGAHGGSAGYGYGYGYSYRYGTAYGYGYSYGYGYGAGYGAGYGSGYGGGYYPMPYPVPYYVPVPVPACARCRRPYRKYRQATRVSVNVATPFGFVGVNTASFGRGFSI